MNRGTFDRSGQRILSRPVGVTWAGWESNTFRLQQAGWELAVEYDIHRDAYRLLVHHHQGDLYGMSNATEIDRRMADAWNEDLPNAFQMTGLARALEIYRHDGVDVSFANFRQIDATPQLASTSIERLEDYNVFKTITTRADEILIEKADMTVIEHLQAIKDLQSGTQEEIRNRMLDDRARGEKASPEGEVHSNIILLRPVA